MNNHHVVELSDDLQKEIKWIAECSICPRTIEVISDHSLKAAEEILSQGWEYLKNIEVILTNTHSREENRYTNVIVDGVVCEECLSDARVDIKW